MLVLVVVMGFLRMRRSVHAKKKLPHQILKDKGRLQSAKCGFSQQWREALLPIHAARRSTGVSPVGQTGILPVLLSLMQDARKPVPPIAF